MSAALSTVQASITILTVDGFTITRDIARQLDLLRSPDDRERFQPIGRIRTGTDYYLPGIELIGTDTVTGALVRLFHQEPIRFSTPGHPEDSQREEEAAQESTETGLCDTLSREYRRLPLIVLPREGRRP